MLASKRQRTKLPAAALLLLASCAGAPAEVGAPARGSTSATATIPAPSASVPVAPAPTASVSPAVRARRSRAADHGPSADLDGDGFADLVLRADEKTLLVVPGSAAGPRVSGKINLDLPGTRWNYGMATTGDLNGDGLVDLVVGAPLAPPTGSIAIFVSAPGKLPQKPTTTLTIAGLDRGAELGAAVALADVDGDGIDDLLASAPAAFTSGTGKVFVFPGSPRGLAAAPSLVIESPTRASSTAFGASLANLGDVDGDGIDDIAIGAYREDGRRGVVYIYRGRRGGIAAEPWIVLRAPKGAAGFGSSVVRAGDVDGDGRADMLAGGDTTLDPRAFLFFGSALGPAAAPSQILFARGRGGAHLSTAGDVNGDGHADLLAGDTSRGAFGAATLLFGGPHGYDEARSIDLPNAWRDGAFVRHTAYFGYGVAPAGDVNGDGFDDILAAGHEATLFWPGARSFTVRDPIVIPGTTASAPTFSH